MIFKPFTEQDLSNLLKDLSLYELKENRDNTWYFVNKTNTKQELRIDIYSNYFSINIKLNEKDWRGRVVHQVIIIRNSNSEIEFYLKKLQ